jgi:hypothetical protein
MGWLMPTSCGLWRGTACTHLHEYGFRKMTPPAGAARMAPKGYHVQGPLTCKGRIHGKKGVFFPGCLSRHTIFHGLFVPDGILLLSLERHASASPKGPIARRAKQSSRCVVFPLGCWLMPASLRMGEALRALVFMNMVFEK